MLSWAKKIVEVGASARIKAAETASAARWKPAARHSTEASVVAHPLGSAEAGAHSSTDSHLPINSNGRAASTDTAGMLATQETQMSILQQALQALQPDMNMISAVVRKHKGYVSQVTGRKHRQASEVTQPSDWAKSRPLSLHELPSLLQKA